MSDYIDREAFIENKRRIYCAACERRMGVRNGKAGMIYEIGGAPCRSCGIDDALGDLEDFPASEVAEVKHARWIRSAYDGEYYCSYCAKMTTDRHDEIRYFEGQKVIALCLPRYCGNCGAKMDESGDEDNG